jgi:uncharacterized protein (DUF1330 family)
MSAYIIASVDVTDMDQYRKYTAVTPDIIAQYGGKFIVRGGETVTLEGAEISHRTVVIEFPSLQQAQDFYHSEEYTAAKLIRKNAATASFIAVDGV